MSSTATSAGASGSTGGQTKTIVITALALFSLSLIHIYQPTRPY